jgi:hypothetical protein
MIPPSEASKQTVNGDVAASPFSLLPIASQQQQGVQKIHPLLRRVCIAAKLLRATRHEWTTAEQKQEAAKENDSRKCALRCMLHEV